MIQVTVKHIPQDTEWNRSFNVLVPLDIQGKTGELLKEAQPPNMQHGSIGAQVKIEGKHYCLPVWSFIKTAIVRQLNPNYSI